MGAPGRPEGPWHTWRRSLRLRSLVRTRGPDTEDIPGSRPRPCLEQLGSSPCSNYGHPIPRDLDPDDRASQCPADSSVGHTDAKAAAMCPEMLGMKALYRTTSPHCGRRKGT